MDFIFIFGNASELLTRTLALCVQMQQELGVRGWRF
jgi:hypothetical protein